MSKDDLLQEPIVEHTIPSTDSKDRVKNKEKKRKRNEIQSSTGLVKKLKTKRRTFENETKIDVETGLNNSFAEMDSQSLADYVAKRTKTYESDLSPIELEDKYISASFIVNTVSWQKPRSLENLPQFLEQYSEDVKKLWSASKKNGAPHSLVIACAGLRASEIARFIRRYPKKEAKVAKLFAKHIKIQESINFLKTNRTGIAVGTPQRIIDLIIDGTLRVDHLKRIIIDASHIDQKKRGILEIKETQVPLVKLLALKEIRERFVTEKDNIKLIFY
ncbi:hypothetical protein EV44_g4429 [Erysiphe necator]|uniref:Protein CMS1 n=1 Tax=Uncinula necator TaxID=52586 RepID=A0A0B1P5G3_UNCNE|nr:hypothetical protein EV44_g4429 [Erysiphe necator]